MGPLEPWDPMQSYRFELPQNCPADATVYKIHSS